jgi:hypothetical protein
MTDPTLTPQTPPQGLTDEQLLELAAREIEPYDRIPPGEYEADYQQALEVYGSELIAAMRAAIAADRAARPTPTPEALQAVYAAWFKAEQGIPPAAAAARTAAAFALALLRGEVAA